MVVEEEIMCLIHGSKLVSHFNPMEMEIILVWQMVLYNVNLEMEISMANGSI